MFLVKGKIGGALFPGCFPNCITRKYWQPEKAEKLVCVRSSLFMASCGLVAKANLLDLWRLLSKHDLDSMNDC